MRFWRRDLRRVDPLLFRLAHELVQPGSIVWDIGANVGLFAFAAAFLAGRSGSVLAIEADDWLAALLRKSTLSLPANHARIDVLTTGVAAATSIADFCLAQRGRAANHLASVTGSTQAGGVRSVQKVVTVTLDWLLDWFPPPHLVKLDVEGAELECLRGANQLLTRERPALICEISSENAPGVGCLLSGHGYTLYDAEKSLNDRVPLEIPAWNTIAVPVPSTRHQEAPPPTGGVSPRRTAVGRTR
ncbi:MAG TPA: FkbM family methyltransferase [Thermoanaerobaculia bacterium]|nr:FkbM family methyltransferase [Thermoanaerobaculia bacterium]